MFYYEITQEPEKACKMAREAFDEAIADLDNVLDEYYKDCLLYTSDAADDLLCVDLGGRRIIKKK